MPKLPPLALALPLLASTPFAQDPGPLELEPGDTICLMGNALAERMQHDGWFELELQRRFPGAEVSVRNLGFSADALTIHQRTMNFGKFTADGMAMTLANERYVPWDRYLDHCDAAVVLAFFGFNESFDGSEGLERFQSELRLFVEHVRAQRYDGEAAPELVLVGPNPFEDTGDPNRPDAAANNARLAPYAAAMGRVAGELGVRFVDVFTPLAARHAASGSNLTIDGIHLNQRGNAALAEVLAEALFPDAAPRAIDDQRVREKVLEKNLLWFNRYRATDGYNVYGGRSRQVYDAGPGTDKVHSNWDVLQRELDHLDALCANRDREIQAAARGAEIERDDSNAPPLIQVPTNRPTFQVPDFEWLPGGAATVRMTPAPGMKVEVFADEVQFPELANPVQMAFDPRGRLWVATWPTYPHWTPGEPMDDKLLVLEDTDGDGRADRKTVFADDLHNPTGLEHWNGGVLVANAPDLLFLEDTDGDGKADRRERLLHGLSSGDTHHSANSFVLGPDGALYFQEGTFHMSQVESAHGPVRNLNGCVWRFEPRTGRVERYIPYDFANPHGHVFDRWGQDFMTDGTGNNNYYALAFSGYVPEPDKHRGYFTFFQQRSRPCAGTEILSSRAFPAENQGTYLIANVIGFQGIFQYRLVDDGAGFTAEELDPIVTSTDRNFRPADIEVGPDGAIYFLDWHNPIIGHLQHHLRDPARDATHGRVYRVTHADRPTLAPVAIADEELPVLLEALKSPEDRVRYRARIELSGRDSDEVVVAARAWARALDRSAVDYEHHALEALWLQQQHNRMDRELLVELLRARAPRARAAATRVLRYGRRHVPDATELLAAQVEDPDPRVRLEVVVGASFFDTAEAAWVALECLKQPTDRFLDYALAETMRALEPRWKASLRAGAAPAIEDAAAVEFLLGRLAPEELTGLPRVPLVLQALATTHGVARDARARAIEELAALNGLPGAAQVLRTVRDVDAGSSPHAAHVLRELGALLLAGEAPPREALVALAADGRRPETRALAVAATVVADGSAERVWEAGSSSLLGLRAMLEAIPLIPEASTRAALFERVRPIQFAPPAALADAQPRGMGGTGLDAAFYVPPPKNARRETFEAVEPREELRTADFTIDVPPARAVDAFAMRFEGTLFAPADGEYTFETNSDDGSRLYVGASEVVDNDGAHGMVRKRGAIELRAGAHPILVTFCEQGGGQGLVVSWSGPGFAMQPIPPEALGGRRSNTTRVAAIRATASVPGHAEAKLADAPRLLADEALLDATLDLLRSVPPAERAPEGVRPVLDTLAAWVAGLAPGERTSPRVVAALELGRELARALPDDEATAATERLAGLGGTIVLLRTLPHQMLYDLEEFWVEAGKPVSIVFQNNDLMPHNFVVTQPGAMAAVGQAAELLSGQPGAEERAFLPEHDAVLWHTGLLYPGQSERLTFVAPEEPADHPFVCTYPGHWRVMNGVMHVVDKLDPEQRLTRRTSDEAPAASRQFVKSWSMADFVPLFDEGWERGRSPERGRELFTEAGCVKCHTVSGEGSIGGPELTKIRDKYCAEEMLRHVLEPSYEVLDDYRFWALELDDGDTVIGRILAEDAERVSVIEALLEPERVTELEPEWIVARRDTVLSPMPTGLLVTFTRAEILDLVSFLQAPGGG